MLCHVQKVDLFPKTTVLQSMVSRFVKYLFQNSTNDNCACKYYSTSQALMEDFSQLLRGLLNTQRATSCAWFLSLYKNMDIQGSWAQYIPVEAQLLLQEYLDAWESSANWTTFHSSMSSNMTCPTNQTASTSMSTTFASIPTTPVVARGKKRPKIKESDIDDYYTQMCMQAQSQKTTGEISFTIASLMGDYQSMAKCMVAFGAYHLNLKFYNSIEIHREAPEDWWKHVEHRLSVPVKKDFLIHQLLEENGAIVTSQ